MRKVHTKTSTRQNRKKIKSVKSGLKKNATDTAKAANEPDWKNVEGNGKIHKIKSNTQKNDNKMSKG